MRSMVEMLQMTLRALQSGSKKQREQVADEVRAELNGGVVFAPDELHHLRYTPERSVFVLEVPYILTKPQRQHLINMWANGDNPLRNHKLLVLDANTRIRVITPEEDHGTRDTGSVVGAPLA